ncbi:MULTISPECIES: hypothetical protein [unclassified Bradyrhizobium]|uniref:hypothetical protein n=1 Tax=unclassified Bradyrhizobium TaxID=2631580 RepID=UPI0023AE79EB|nr:hypothetical protein [Bradyrhizobium sp. CSS354]MDE5461545.1 hypothetical protein [Bradyrhizobium sp. CSS354]
MTEPCTRSGPLLPFHPPAQANGFVLIQINSPLWLRTELRAMKPPEELRPRKDDQPIRPSRLEEMRLLIEEYAAGLREIIKKLLRKLN